MELSPPVTSPRKAFCFTEELEDGVLEAYSCGKGRFVEGLPSADYDVCFSVYKTEATLDIQVRDIGLILWLDTVTELQDVFDNGRLVPSISMDVLLPCYPAIKERLMRDRREMQSFHALELFVHGFLQEGSILEIFGFEDLHERNFLTDLHFHDIQSQYRSMSEDLDYLDELVDQLDERDVTGPKHGFIFLDESLRPELRDAIRKYNSKAVASVLARDPGAVDAKTICIAIRFYEPFIFRLLIDHGSQVDGDDVITEPLYRAAKAGYIDAVKMLLEHDANIEGGKFCISATPLTGAASGGHLEIVQYLVENGANVNGNQYKSPLTRALKHGHMNIVECLLNSGADIFKASCALLSTAVDSGILTRYIARLGGDDRERLLSEAASNGYFRLVQILIEHGVNVNSIHHKPPLCGAAEKGFFDIVQFLVDHGANVNSTHQKPPLCFAAEHSRLDIVRFLVYHGADVNPTHHKSPLCFAAENDALDIVRFLVDHGAYVNSAHYQSPLYYAARGGKLDAVRFLVLKGANINYEDVPFESQGECRSPLAAAVFESHVDVATFLAKLGASLIKGEENTTIKPDWINEFGDSRVSIGGRLEDMISGRFVASPMHWPYPFRRPLFCYPPEPFGYSNLFVHLQSHHMLPEVPELDDCPIVAAIRVQERRNMVRRLLAKVSKSRQKLLDAGDRQSVSEGFSTFAEQLGASSFLWKKGTRAIRGMIDGFFPDEFSDIIGGLLVADAMRAAVPPSELVCSKQEFGDDLYRWASLIKPNDRELFVEVASCLWGSRSWETMWEEADRISHSATLAFLQTLVANLMNKSGLFDNDDRIFSGSYRLRSLRQRSSLVRPAIHGPDKGRPLAECRPPDKPGVLERMYTDASKPPDTEDCPDALAWMTFLMAGAIFGAIILYLCQSRYGFAMLFLHIPASPVPQGWAANRILTRNCFILAMSLGLLSLVLGSGVRETTDNISSKAAHFTTEVQGSKSLGSVQEQMPAMWSLTGSAYTTASYPSAEDTIMHDMPTDYSSSPSDLQTTSPITALSTSTMPTITPASPPQEEGTISCPHKCGSTFKLGKNGRRGRDSNLRKHINAYHIQRARYECKFGCGYTDRHKSNAQAHEENHCFKKKGRKPRGAGKRSRGGLGTS